MYSSKSLLVATILNFFKIVKILVDDYDFRATPMKVVIKGVILITAKMGPQRQKIRLQ